MKRGFTLIEVMVVLSILAIIAILSYNFFGSVYKDATENQLLIKSHKEMTAVSEAIQLYVAKHGTAIPEGLTDIQEMDLLVDEGYLKARLAPSAALSTLPDYHIIASDSASFDMSGGSRGDLLIQTAYAVSDNICLKWNNLFAPQAGGVIPTWTAVGAYGRMSSRFQSLCVRNPTDATKRYIRFVAIQDLGVSF